MPDDRANFMLRVETPIADWFGTEAQNLSISRNALLEKVLAQFMDYAKSLPESERVAMLEAMREEIKNPAN